MKKWLLVIVGSSVLGVILFTLLQGDKQKINKELDELCALISTKQQEKPVESLNKAARIGTFFTEICHIKIEERNRSQDIERKEIIQRAIMIRKQSSGLQLELKDRTIEIAESKTSATVLGTLYLQGMEGTEVVRDVQEARLTMSKEDGRWLISEIVIIAVLEH